MAEDRGDFRSGPRNGFDVGIEAIKKFKSVRAARHRCAEVTETPRVHGVKVLKDGVGIVPQLKIAGTYLVEPIAHVDVNVPIQRDGLCRQLGSHERGRINCLDPFDAQTLGERLRLRETQFGQTRSGMRGIQLPEDIARSLTVAYEKKPHGFRFILLMSIVPFFRDLSQLVGSVLRFTGKMTTTVFTIGHSTHPFEEFVSMLAAHGVTKIVDVRTVPGSRHNPQFGQKALEASLPEAGIDYEWKKSLGGLRRTTKASENLAWRNSSFRGYADYMQTAEFSDAVEELVREAEKSSVAIMCAEAVPWRCHRSLIGDALLVRGVQVLDIMTQRSAKPHELTPFAQVEGTRVRYPPT